MMALCHLHFKSEILKQDTALFVALPSTKEHTPVLFLFHGLSGDHTSWIRRSSAERYAEATGIAIVMPEAHRSFYTNMPIGYRYFDYVSLEVPELTSHVFPYLATDPKKRGVAGLSMGGYGAFKVALSYPEDYAIAGSFSGALDVRSLSRGEEGWEAEYRGIFGDPVTFLPENDLFHLLGSAYEKGSRLPFLYQTCGTEDFLLENNRAFRRKLEANPKIETLYLESRGDHEWDYWDRQLNAFMKAFQRLISKE